MKKKLLVAGIIVCGLALTACNSEEVNTDKEQVTLSLNVSTENSGAGNVLTPEVTLEDEDVELDETNDTKTEVESPEEEPTPAPTPEPTEAQAEAPTESPKTVSPSVLENGQAVAFDTSWQYADFSEIHSGSAVFYKAESNRKNIVIAVNAGHGTKGGSSVKTYCHPDMSAKTTGGSTASGSTKAAAVSGGMSFSDGTPEASVTLAMARKLRDRLLAEGYDVLMIRDGEDVQLDNVARTVMANNMANCHIAIHWDGDGLNYDKGCFYISVPEGIKGMEPVASHWQQHNALGSNLVEGLKNAGCKINGGGSMAVDLTQTSYSTIPSVDMELGNQSSDHSDAALDKLAEGMVSGINAYFGQ